MQVGGASSQFPAGKKDCAVEKKGPILCQLGKDPQQIPGGEKKTKLQLNGKQKKKHQPFSKATLIIQNAEKLGKGEKGPGFFAREAIPQKGGAQVSVWT